MIDIFRVIALLGMILCSWVVLGVLGIGVPIGIGHWLVTAYAHRVPALFPWQWLIGLLPALGIYVAVYEVLAWRMERRWLALQAAGVALQPAQESS